MNRNILVEILAHVDAIFMPDRDPPVGNRREIFYTQRRNYLRDGLPMKRIGGGLNAADRLNQSNDLAELQRCKLITIRSLRGMRSTNIQLTDRGDSVARALVGCPIIDEAIPYMRTLAQTNQRAQQCGDEWTPETILAGVPWGGPVDLFKEVQLVMTPALVRGLVRSNADAQGHLWYTLTPTGKAFLRSPVMNVARLPRVSIGLCERFWETQAEARGRVLSLPYDQNELGDIPIGSSLSGFLPKAAR